MIGIAQKVARNFSDAVRSRGQSYFVKGRVAVMAARPGEVVAKVRGTSKYRVRLRMRGSKLLASCTCPYFSPQGEPCKHLWATLLLAEARGLLQSAPVFPVQLVPESPRRTSAVGLPEFRSEPGGDSELPRPHPADLDLGGIDLGPPRWPGHRPARPRPEARSEALGVTVGVILEVGASEALCLGTTVPAPAAGPRPKRLGLAMVPALARPGPRPSTVMPSDCLSMYLMFPPHWRKTKSSLTWLAASAKQRASGDHYGPGTTPRTPLTSSTTRKTG